MDSATRIRRAHTFDEIAELYDRGRREVPGHVVDDLFAQTGLDPSSTRILEIGCGTGQATLPLARRGCHVVCVEMGANLARIARRNLSGYPRVRVDVARFEDWQLAGLSFDIVLAVTSWHWVDPQFRYAKAAQVLRPGGILAFTTGAHVFPPGFDPFFAEIQNCYEAIGQGRLEWPPPAPEAMPDACAEIENSGYFEKPCAIRRIWAEEFTAEEHVALMSTASDHRLMQPAKREQLFAEMRRLIHASPGGRVCKHNLTILHLARKKA